MTPSTSLIQTIAGTGRAGYDGDGGQAAEAALDQPFHCDLDGRGSLYLAEAGNHCVRKLDLATGVITMVAGCGAAGYSGDGGPATQAAMNEPYAVQVDANGDLYIVDRLNAAVRRVDAATGVISTVAGTGEKGYGGDGGPGAAAKMREPNDCWLDGSGGLLIADILDQRVRRLDLRSGVIDTFAGTGDRARTGDGGPAAEAGIDGARAVCGDSEGNIFICEREGNGLRKVDTRGIITTVAGTGERGYAGDGGPASHATFDGPKAVRCDDEGNVFVVDTENHAVRRIDAVSGTVTTVAGGRRGSGGDGGAAASAGLDRPHGCAIDSRGNIFIADSNNHRVRLVSPAQP